MGIMVLLSLIDLRLLVIQTCEEPYSIDCRAAEMGKQTKVVLVFPLPFLGEDETPMVPALLVA